MQAEPFSHVLQCTLLCRGRSDTICAARKLWKRVLSAKPDFILVAHHKSWLPCQMCAGTNKQTHCTAQKLAARQGCPSVPAQVGAPAVIFTVEVAAAQDVLTCLLTPGWPVALHSLH